jgi:hypothetical protein
MSCSRFSRPYWGNHSYFLFLRLIICLNSAGNLTNLRFDCRTKVLCSAQSFTPKLAQCMLRNPTSYNTHKVYLPDIGFLKTQNTLLTDARCCCLGSHSLESSIAQSIARPYSDALTEASGLVGFTNTQTGMLPGISWKRNVRSKFWWFTRSCNSHYVSHFAAFFIVVGPKTSIAESCIYIRITSWGVLTCTMWG